MRKFVISLFVVVLVIGVIYFSQAAKRSNDAVQIQQQERLFEHVEFLKIYATNSIEKTFSYYKQNFSESELALYKQSLDTIRLTIDIKRTEIRNLEIRYNENLPFSTSLGVIYETLTEISENLETYDEASIQKIGVAMNRAFSELHKHYFKSVGKQFLKFDFAKFFDEASHTMNALNEEIQALIDEN